MVRVTIVGGGYGGITAAKALDECAEVTLIEQKDTFVNHAAALRATVDPDWAQKIFLPYDHLLKNGRVVHATAMSVDGTTVRTSDGQVIEAEQLILATGTAYPFPAKHMDSPSAVAKARIARTNDALAAARRVLILGAGAVGVELAGEITSAFPDLHVIMVESADDILCSSDYKSELREAIRAQLLDRGVEIITGDKLAYLPSTDVATLSPFTVETKAGRTIEADIWFRAYGARVASSFLGQSYADIRHYDGTIRVDEYLRVIDHPHVWAIGDLTDVRESKRADAARAHAEVVATNIKSIIAGGAPTKRYRPAKEWVILPLGPDGGASQILRDGVRVVVGPEETSRIKGEDLFVDFVREQLGLNE